MNNNETVMSSLEEQDVIGALPIAEIFTSPQGEGVWSGTRMTFIRTAGCTVGKPFPKERYEMKFKDVGPGLRDVVHTTPLPIYVEQCTLYDGRNFACDTDYRVKARMLPNEVIKHIPPGTRFICLTGGEPLMHQRRLAPLLKTLKTYGYMIHVETSGTIHLDTNSLIDWVTVAPKFGVLPSMISRANELKLLVDNDFDPNKLPFNVVEYSQYRPVYLMPVGDEKTVIAENIKLCMEWQEKLPSLRIGLQLHKVLYQFTNVMVR